MIKNWRTDFDFFRHFSNFMPNQCEVNSWLVLLHKLLTQSVKQMENEQIMTKLNLRMYVCMY